MKLVARSFAKDDSGDCTLIPEEAEDLWHLYNLLAVGDALTSNTKRKVTKESGSGSVQAETKHVNLTITVKSIEYDAAGECIRVSGTCAKENPFVRMGAHHTSEVGLNMKVTVAKPVWDFVHLQLLKDATDTAKSAEVAVLLMDAGVANMYLLTAVLAKDLCQVAVNLPKKRAEGSGYDKALGRFFDSVYAAVLKNINWEVVKCVVLAGPGFVKDDFFTFMIQNATRRGDTVLLKNQSAFTVTHASCAHKMGLKELLASDSACAKILSAKAAAHVTAMNDFYKTLKTEPDRAVYGPKHVAAAADMGGIATLMITDGLFRSSDAGTRRRHVEMAEAVAASGAKVHVFSEQHATGQQLAQLGGLAALLRYAAPEADLDEEDEDGDASASDSSSA